jgi:hypothetical protein
MELGVDCSFEISFQKHGRLGEQVLRQSIRWLQCSLRTILISIFQPTRDGQLENNVVSCYDSNSSPHFSPTLSFQSLSLELKYKDGPCN